MDRQRAMVRSAIATDESTTHAERRAEWWTERRAERRIEWNGDSGRAFAIVLLLWMHGGGSVV